MRFVALHRRSGLLGRSLCSAGVPSLELIRSALQGHRAKVVRDPARPRAAVALVVRERTSGPELLFIERARRRGDPWSGHMAFPGGRMEPSDGSTRMVAERETEEEVGLALAEAERLGRLDDLQGHAKGRPLALVIAAYVYHLAQDQVLSTNHEVEQALWVPVGRLLDPAHQVDYPSATGRYPGILVGDPERHIVWGLTYRFLELFFAVLGCSLPGRGPLS